MRQYQLLIASPPVASCSVALVPLCIVLLQCCRDSRGEKKGEEGDSLMQRGAHNFRPREFALAPLPPPLF